MMILMSLNVSVQLLGVMIVHRRKTWKDKLKEVLITIFFLRPCVDAYRMSMNEMSHESMVSSLSEMILNKSIELTFESIPGGVLQIYVWLKKSSQTRNLEVIFSVFLSALTTGYTSALIAFDSDIDVTHRKHQPKFYGECGEKCSESRAT